MLHLIDLASVPSDPLAPFTDRLRLAVAAYLARFKARPVIALNPTCTATSPGGLNEGWTRWPPSGRAWLYI